MAPKNCNHKYYSLHFKILGSYGHYILDFFGIFWGYLISFRLKLISSPKKSNKIWKFWTHEIYWWQNTTHHKVFKVVGLKMNHLKSKSILKIYIVLTILRQVWGWDSHSQKWELGVLWDSHNFRSRWQRSKHLVLRCSLYCWKDLEV
jgi:hypothetical protein